MRSRVGRFLCASLAAVMVLGLVPVLPAAPAAAAPPEWTVAWDRDVSADVGRPVGVAVASDGSYYVAGRTLAKYAADGGLLWKVSPGWEGIDPTSVACDDDYVYMSLSAPVANSTGWLYKFDANDGSYVWAVQIPGWRAKFSDDAPKIDLDDGIVYVALNTFGNVVKMDTGDGSSLGTVPTNLPNTETGGVEVRNDGVWVCYSDDGPSYIGQYLHNGDPVWRSSTSDFTDPALFQDRVYLPYNNSYAEGLRIAARSTSDGSLVDDFAFPQADYIHENIAALDCDDDGAIYAAIPEAHAVVKIWQASGSTEPTDQTIDNGQVKVTVQPNGTPQAYVWYDGEWVRQYYSEDNWGTVLLMDGYGYTTGYLSADDQFVPVTNTVETLDGGKAIVTVLDAGDSGVRVTQTITLMDGDRYITKDWKVENLGGEIVGNMRLYHGGDTYFGNDDSASAYYDQTKSMIYLRNEQFTDWGIMGFWANPATPASHYFGGSYSDGYDYIDNEEDLPDIADPVFQDAGYYLQWNHFNPLFPGQSWHIQAYEIWTPGGPLQVLAPGSQYVLPGSTVVLPFTLHNIGEVPQDITLSAECDDPSWNVEVLGDTEPAIGGLDRIPVAVRVTVPSDADGSAVVTLHADGPETSGAGSTRLSVMEAKFTVEPSEAEMRAKPGEWVAQDITITNNSDEDMKLGVITFSDPAHFGNGEGEGNYRDIGPGDSTTFSVYFGADEFGEYPCTVSIPVSSPWLVTATVQLTGICAMPDPVLTFEPDAVEFSTVTGEWCWQDVTITNDSEYAVDFGTLSTTGEVFALGEHEADGRTLQPGTSVTVPVGFKSDEAGDFDGELIVPVTGPVEKQFSVPLSATAVVAEAVPVDIQGKDRYATAIEASKDAFPDGAPAVVIATGADFPDALAGAALAGVLDAPVLLTRPNELIEPVKAEIDRLGAKRVYVLGGGAALTPTVFNALSRLLGADNVKRIGGANRYETAELVAAEVVRLLGDDYDGTAFVATGRTFADATACSPIAAAKGRPIYLSAYPAIAGRTVAAMKSAGVKHVVVLGQTGAVSAQSVASINAAGITSDRIGGANRYETAALVATYGVSDAGLAWDGVGVARGDVFADALVGGAALGRLGSVLVLTEPTKLPSPIEAVLAAQAGTVKKVRFYGGPAAISAAVRAAVLGLF